MHDGQLLAEIFWQEATTQQLYSMGLWEFVGIFFVLCCLFIPCYYIVGYINKLVFKLFNG